MSAPGSRRERKKGEDRATITIKISGGFPERTLEDQHRFPGGRGGEFGRAPFLDDQFVRFTNPGEISPPQQQDKEIGKTLGKTWSCTIQKKNSAM